MYVVTCLKFLEQGIDYDRSVEDHPQNQSCAIQKHFAEADHGPEDLYFLLWRITPTATHKTSCDSIFAPKTRIHFDLPLGCGFEQTLFFVAPFLR